MIGESDELLYSDGIPIINTTTHSGHLLADRLGAAELHQVKCVIHRDLKLANILTARGNIGFSFNSSSPEAKECGVPSATRLGVILSDQTGARFPLDPTPTGSFVRRLRVRKRF
jgi:serine/threonine protein kinase